MSSGSWVLSCLLRPTVSRVINSFSPNVSLCKVSLTHSTTSLGEGDMGQSHCALLPRELMQQLKEAACTPVCPAWVIPTSASGENSNPGRKLTVVSPRLSLTEPQWRVILSLVFLMPSYCSCTSSTPSAARSSAPISSFMVPANM